MAARPQDQQPKLARRGRAGTPPSREQLAAAKERFTGKVQRLGRARLVGQRKGELIWAYDGETS